MADLSLRYDYTLKVTNHELRLILAGLHDIKSDALRADALALQARLVEQRASLLKEAAGYAERYENDVKGGEKA